MLHVIGKVNRLSVFAAVSAIISLLLCTLPVSAFASESSNSDEYVWIGKTQVASSLEIHNQAELDDFILSDIPKTVGFDPKTGEFVLVEPGNEEYSVTAEQAIEMKKYQESLAKSNTTQITRSRPVTLYHSSGYTTSFNNSGSHYGSWPGITKLTTGSWTANLVYVYNGITGSTSTCGPGGTYYPVYGHAVDGTALYMV